MWENFYIQTVLIAAGFLVAIYIMRDEFYEEPAGLLVALIPIAVISIVSYLGFYKFWQKNKD